MANRIKGITVEIGGDTTKLSKALEGVNKTIKNTQTQLKDVEKLLKLDPRVHYYVDNVCAWQNLPLSLSGWHAADGSGNGNRRTIAIECIMSSAYNDKDKKSEDNCAKLAAALLNKYKLSIDCLYTHNHWYSRKYCPAYILPHWDKFKAKVQSYMNFGSSSPATPSAKQIYRVRKSWSDAKSQIGAFSSLENAKRACKAGYYVFDEKGNALFPAKKSVDEIAREVIHGKWGNGSERKNRLTNAGYDYNAVQKKVNELIK